MYSNTPPPLGIAVPGALATTGIDGMEGLGLTAAALALVVTGALILRTAYLKRGTELAVA